MEVYNATRAIVHLNLHYFKYNTTEELLMNMIQKFVQYISDKKLNFWKEEEKHFDGNSRS